MHLPQRTKPGSSIVLHPKTVTSESENIKMYENSSFIDSFWIWKVRKILSSCRINIIIDKMFLSLEKSNIDTRYFWSYRWHRNSVSYKITYALQTSSRIIEKSKYILFEITTLLCTNYWDSWKKTDFYFLWNQYCEGNDGFARIISKSYLPIIRPIHFSRP